MFRRIGIDNLALASVSVIAAGTLISAAFDSQIADAELPEAAAAPHTQTHITQSIVNTLNDKGVVVIKGVLSANELSMARSDVLDIVNEGRLESSANDDSVRVDTLCWLRETDGTAQAPLRSTKEVNSLGPGILHCISLLRGTMYALDTQEVPYSRSHSHRVPHQCQLARYSGREGEAAVDAEEWKRYGYVPHRDAADDNNFWEVGLLGWLRGADYRQRSMTAILYLNKEDWNQSPEEDGGALCCYIDADSGDSTGETSNEERVLRVSPSGGTLVLFDSRYLLHEVAPTNTDRYALTLWVAGERTPIVAPNKTLATC